MSTHQRDGSLLRKKQDQWARERAEESENIWFPFGSPGGGTPNRKYESIDYGSPIARAERAEMQEAPSHDRSSDHNEESSSHMESISSAHKKQQNYVKMTSETESRRCSQQDPPHSSYAPQQLPMAYPIPFHYSYPGTPVGFPTNAGPNGMQWNYLQPIPINVVPAGTVPIPIQDLSRSIAEGKPICPVTVAENLAQMSPHNGCWVQGTSVPMAVPIPTTLAHNAPVDPDQEPHSSNTSNVAVVPPMEQGSLESTLTRRSAAYSERRSSTADYDQQIAERKRLEAEEAERERYEEMEIRRVKEEKARREAEKERKQKEEEQYREQERERVRQTLEEALERAKREAEVTRKARVFKHVLDGPQKSPELERRLLGVDPETGDRILQEISQLERHKKLEQESFAKPPRTGRSEQSGDSPIGQRSRSVPKTRSQSVSESMTSADSREETPSGKQTASIRPFMSLEDRRVVPESQQRDMRKAATTNTSTPLHRGAPGRMSVRVTKREKENSPLDNSYRITTRGAAQNIPSPQHRDQTMLPSKIPVATPVTSATRSGHRQGARPPQPLKNANHLSSQSDTDFDPKYSSISATRPVYLPPTSKNITDNPLFSPVATRRRLNRMRGLSDSPVNVDSAGSSGSTEESNEGNCSSGCASPEDLASSPLPAVVSHDLQGATKTVTTHNNNELKVRSTISTPAAYLGPMSKTSSFTRKLVEKGCINHSTDALSPEVRRKVEENLSRAPSMQSLRGSIGNLAGWRGSAMNLADTPNLSRFRSLNPNFRSFNMKKTTEKQQEVIDRLSQLRENLRSSENFVDRGIIPKRNNNLASPAVIKT